MNSLDSSTAFQRRVEVFAPLEGTVSTAFIPPHRVRVYQPHSAWMRELEDRFNEVVRLPIGWDGYGGQPVSFTTARFSASIIERLYTANLPAPSIVPGADGSMQIEWHLNGYDVELDVLGPLNIVAYRYDHVTDEEEELQLDSDITQVAAWISDLCVHRDLPIRVLA